MNLSDLILFSLMGLVFPLYIYNGVDSSFIIRGKIDPPSGFSLCILPQRDGTRINLTMPPCREAALPEAHATMKCSK